MKTERGCGGVCSARRVCERVYFSLKKGGKDLQRVHDLFVLSGLARFGLFLDQQRFARRAILVGGARLGSKRGDGRRDAVDHDDEDDHEQTEPYRKPDGGHDEPKGGAFEAFDGVDVANDVVDFGGVERQGLEDAVHCRKN